MATFRPSAHGEALTIFAQERVDYTGVKVQGIHVVIIELQGSVQLFSEINWAGSEGLEGMKVDNNKPQRLSFFPLFAV